MLNFLLEFWNDIISFCTRVFTGLFDSTGAAPFVFSFFIFFCFIRFIFIPILGVHISSGSDRVKSNSSED